MTCVFTYEGREYVGEDVFKAVLKGLPLSTLTQFINGDAAQAAADLEAARKEQRSARGAINALPLDDIRTRSEAYVEADRRRNAAELRLTEAEIAFDRASRDDGVPDMPFRSTWPALVMKRMISWAATNGFDSIAWATGTEQAERYGLEKHVKTLRLFDFADGSLRLEILTHTGSVSERRIEDEEDLRNTVGRETAEKLLSAERSETRVRGEGVTARALTGLDLKTGGEGMKAFYDRNLVNITNGLLKRYGVKVGKVEIEGVNEGRAPDTPRLIAARERLADVRSNRGDTTEVANAEYRQAESEAIEELREAVAESRVVSGMDAHPGFDITPELREAARGGFPLFNRRNNATDRAVERDNRRAGLLARGEPPAPKDFATLAAKWKPKLEASLKRLGIEDRILLRVVDRIAENPTADGSYYRRVISVALETSPAPARTFNHEAVHALRALGVFRPAEWTAVTKAAAPLLADVRRRYAGQALNPEQIEEEAVADLYAAWQEKRDAKGFVAKAFQRIADLFRAVRAALAGDVDAQAVFRGIEAGRVGRRETGSGTIEPADPLFSTDAFRRWFGKSAVVDENGAPLVVYHGTTRQIASFRPGVSRLGDPDIGMHFGTKDAAEHRMRDRREIDKVKGEDRTVSVYLSIQNPLRLKDVGNWKSPTRIARAIEEDHPELVAKIPMIDRNIAEEEVIPWLRGELEKAGYDGIVYENSYEAEGSDSWIAFRPSQIKSTANRGTWDPADDRIMFSISDPAPTKRIRVIKKNAFPDASIEATFLIERGTGPRWPKGLNLGDYDLFWRKVMVDELQGQDELPYGFTPESLAEAKRHIDKLVSGSAVVEAAARRYSFAKMLDEQVQGITPETVMEARSEPLEGDEPPRAANIRLDKLESPKDIGAALEAIAERFDDFDDSRRGVVSHEETTKLAEDLDMTPEQLLTRRQGQAFNAHELLAARQLLVASADNMVELAAKAQGGSDEDLVNFRRAWVRHVAIQEQVSGMTAEAGRALNQFKLLARSGGDLNARMMREVLNTEGGRQDVEDVAKAILGFANDPAKMNSFARDAYSPTWRDKLFELWINGLLSGPATHVVNVVSNTLTSLAQLPEYAAAAGIGKLRSLRDSDADRIYGSEIGARATGMIQGAREASLLAVEALRTGEGSDILSKMEARTQHAISGKKGEIVRIPGRLLVASDEFFKGAARRVEMSALAVRQAKKEGLTGDEFRSRVAELNAAPTPEMIEAGMEFARYSTFTRPLGPMGQSVTNVINAIPGMRLIVPFIRTPANIFKFAIARTPAAPILREVREDFKAGGVARDLAISRVVLGSALGATVMQLAAAGILTGGEPEDDDARRLLKANGWQPYSVKIGSTYYSYQRLDPLATIMGLGADLAATHEHMSQEEKDEAYSNMFLAIMNQLKNKTFLSGIGSMIEAIEDPGRFGPVFIAKMAGTVIPTGVNQINNQIDPTVRDARGPLERIRSRVPGLSDDLKPKRDVWGRPILREGGVGPDFASPFWTSKDKDDVVTEKLLELGVALDVPKRKIGGVELTPDQYEEYQIRAGEYLRTGTENVMASRAWEMRDDEAKRRLFDKVKDAARKRARAELGLTKAALEAQAAASAGA